jgi:hypothetical protein
VLLSSTIAVYMDYGKLKYCSCKVDLFGHDGHPGHLQQVEYIIKVLPCKPYVEGIFENVEQHEKG